MEEAGDESTAKLSIYRAARTIKRCDNNLYNALRSIYEDSIFVSEIAQLWPDLPLLANLRCGLWYSSKFYSHCYFKSTDGHNNNWSFNTSRLNLHVAQLALQKGGCMIIDSTRRGKRFPDSMSKTIPIWTCILNRCIARYNRSKMNNHNGSSTDELSWDCSLHLPLWVSDTERGSIQNRLETWTDELEAVGADIASIASLKKPLRPLWISQRTVIWLNEVPDHDSWDFTPIILVSGSCSTGPIQQMTSSEFSWNYISGAGDDEESWSRGLTPSLFWGNVYDIINSGPNSCNQRVAEIVEKDRVQRSQRGLIAPQIWVKGNKLNGSIDDIPLEIGSESNGEDRDIAWLASTNIAVCSTLNADKASNVNCVLNCSQGSISASMPHAELHLHLPILTSKFDRFSVLSNLPAAVNFAKMNLTKGNTMLICCHNGEDISICVCLAILISLFNDQGIYDDGKSHSEGIVTKWDMRRRLVFICQYATNARPSRGNLKQVFAFLNGGKDASTSNTMEVT